MGKRAIQIEVFINATVFIGHGKLQREADRGGNGISRASRPNSPLRYVSERCEVGPDEKVEAMGLYIDYQGWCRASRHGPVPRKEFVSRILSTFPAVVKRPYGKNRRTHYLGIGIRLA